MTVRPDYALSRARYTPFLFTIVGTERRDALETVARTSPSSRRCRASASIPGRRRRAWPYCRRVSRQRSPSPPPSSTCPTRAGLLGDAAGTAQRIVDTLPKPSHRAPAPLDPSIFVGWRFWVAVGLVLALVGLSYLGTGVG